MNETRLVAAAVAAFALFAVLGTFVSGRPPTAVDVAGSALRGEATPLALTFTLLGRWYVLAVIAAAATFVVLRLHGDVRVIVAVFASQVISQLVVGAVKFVFHRVRPQDWLVIRETDLSYPSGHAVTTVVFYGALLLIVLRSHVLPRPWLVPLTIVLVVCIGGIPWSRVALGAHYVTDVTGGLLFGCGWLCATLALAQRVTMSSRISP